MAYPLAARREPHAAGGAFDEAFAGPGEPRAHYRSLLGALAERDLSGLAESVRRAAAERRITFLTDGEPEPFPLDPVPRVMEADEWELLERGLAQRAHTLNAFLADIYGERRIVEAGRIPRRVLAAAELCEPDMHGVDVPGGVFAGVAGMDVVRRSNGSFAVLEDNLRTPSGAAYAACAREIVDGVLGSEAPARREGPTLAELLADTLRGAAPDGRGEPVVVLLSDGPGNSAWWEHEELARMTGLAIVTPADLELRNGRVLARTGAVARAVEVDVIYRRTDESRLRGSSGDPTALGELLLEPLRSGTVACVNAFGCGVGDDKLVHAYVEEMTRFYLGEEPLVRSVRTYDPAEPSAREEILERIDELVVKPRDGYGGDGVIVCPHASPEDRRRAEQLVRTEPESYVAQEMVCLSTHPTVVEGELAPRHVDLRAFVFSTPREARVLPGGLTRVALGEGELVVNSSQNGGGKDTWVLAR